MITPPDITFTNYSRKLGQVALFAKEKMPHLPYHNFSHALDVYSAATTLGFLEETMEEDRFMLRTAALLHDLIVVPGRTDNEERSVELSESYLPRIGYSSSEVQRVGQIILATKMPQQPKDHLEQILCDADLDNLGRLDFLELGEKVRTELGIPADDKWYHRQWEFLYNHNYHTNSAHALRDEGKQENLYKLEKIMGVSIC